MPKLSYAKFEIIMFVSALALYSFLALFASSGIWNSPDETANAFFIERLSSGGGLTVFDPSIARSNGLIHPRSTDVREGLLVPGSFLGMIVAYALPVKLLGAWSMPFLTPFFTAFALLAFGRIIKFFFNARIAAIGVALAMTHPALWYYANRGLFHNVFFLDCVIFSLFFALVSPFESIARAKSYTLKLSRITDSLLSGTFFFLALATRTFEAIWLFPLVLTLLFINRKKIASETFFVYGALLLIGAAILIFISYAVYGNVSLSGYPRIELLPFGFSFRNMARNGLLYGKLFFWWYTLMVGAGAAYLIYLRTKAKAPEHIWRWFIILLGISLPLLIVYGSGFFLDTPDPSRVTVGNSILRYWLPLYIGSVPLGAWALSMIAGNFKKTAIQKLFLGGVLVSVALLSFKVVFYGKGEGLVYMRRELKRYEAVRRDVLAATPPNSIIISDKSDKIFFPHRHVVVGTNSESVISSLWELNKIGPLYLYAIAFGEDDPRFSAYQSAGFPLREEMRFGNERLYRLDPH